MEEDIFKMNWSFLCRKNGIYYLKWAEKNEKASRGGRIVQNLEKRWEILNVLFLAPSSQHLLCNCDFFGVDMYDRAGPGVLR